MQTIRQHRLVLVYPGEELIGGPVHFFQISHGWVVVDHIRQIHVVFRILEPFLFFKISAKEVQTSRTLLRFRHVFHVNVKRHVFAQIHTALVRYDALHIVVGFAFPNDHDVARFEHRQHLIHVLYGMR